MCEPLTGMMILGGISALGTAASVAGSIQQGKQQEKVAEYNAAVAEQGAIAEEQKAAYEEEAHRKKVKSILSSQQAAYGATGVDMEGSPLLVMEDTAAQGELDALAIRYGGDVAAAQKRSQANLYRMQGKNARTAGYINAGTSLLTGAANIGNSLYGYKYGTKTKGL